ncbi:winged helix-turn-helix domain-containing protein [Parasphingopyxis marina]|uniref:Winged helix-turn-helix domain-containing protein n=1 Tax=Parasphingopyxis marina TaxID=2761622 RepID=A0A842HWK9_9SPHN|nr:winged helix-turn-helix domain-containing protein [Parasphingopyxis marina]MBC2777352.1 winged helix-turn-helix domain-containing protein [Parasphingopyxis marina]
MNWRFENFELDEAKFELRSAGLPLAAEPQVLSLLIHLVRHRDRLVTKDEINETIWHGRFVSDSALASRVKTLRRLLGDDGRQQRLIRTVHGRGFRFIGDIAENSPAPAPARVKVDEHPAAAIEAPVNKPSIAVLPFRLVGIGGPYAGIAEALPDELIAELSRLRWLFVIARGSSFRFRSASADLRDVGARLGVRYCLSGTAEISGTRMMLAVELADTRDCGVVWSERYDARLDDVHSVRETILSSIVAALELQIPLNEAQRARLVPPENLDAWAAYHLGLDHVFRFNAKDNAIAGALFEQAIAKERGFVRAIAGLSFTHFQNAFAGHTPDFSEQAAAARRLADEAVALDGRDPFANLVMGRAHWLASDLEGSFGWLERATQLSPNYAQGFYAWSWAEALAGIADAGQEHSDLARSLSPLDPLFYGMLGTRALAHMSRGEFEEGAVWAERSARSPGAYKMNHAIAVAAHELTGNHERAAAWADHLRNTSPEFTGADFFRSFPFTDKPAKERMAAALARHGI